MTQTQQQRTRAQLVLDTGEKFTGFVFGAAPEGDIESCLLYTSDAADDTASV